MGDIAEQEFLALGHKMMKCSRDFACVKAGLVGVCEARDIGMKHNLICLDKKACQRCEFGLTVGFAHLCRCPFLVHIAKSFGK